jgi:hypothetical protein
MIFRRRARSALGITETLLGWPPIDDEGQPVVGDASRPLDGAWLQGVGLQVAAKIRASVLIDILACMARGSWVFSWRALCPNDLRPALAASAAEASSWGNP